MHFLLDDDFDSFIFLKLLGMLKKMYRWCSYQNKKIVPKSIIQFAK